MAIDAAVKDVLGRHESGVAVFKGIPFAEPPVRFGAPEPVRAWPGTRDALSYGPPPPQSAAFDMSAVAASEDGWLTVNVWTADPAAGELWGYRHRRRVRDFAGKGLGAFGAERHSHCTFAEFDSRYNHRVGLGVDDVRHGS